MSVFSKYLCKEYVEGKTDCYSVCRDYFRDFWQIELPNLARPTRFWEDPNLDLYGMYADYGFSPVFDRPPQIGDVFLMQIRTPINSHAAVYVEDNQILHHLPGSLSCLAPFRPKWAPRVNVHLRHPDIRPVGKSRVELHEVLDAELLRDPRVQEKIVRAMETRG